MNNEPKLNIREYLVHLFDIKKGTSKAGTIQDIKDGISIRGHTAWILIFSILIASIGLNVSSPAVVIGAMLIAPLMGPLLGIGLALAINDAATLKRSFVNLIAMTAISLLTSFLFFSIPLFQNETPEILARTKPDLRDVLIAIAGGLALIVSLSRRKEMTNTIAGVAIATALMPPLCTAGFGLATGKYGYFFGAMFLFVINSTYIALATYIILRFLRFREVHKVDDQQKKWTIRIASLVSVLILSGSVFTFYRLIQEQQFTRKAQDFIRYLQDEGVPLIDVDDEDIDFQNHSLTLTVFGSSVSPDEQNKWKNKLADLGMPDIRLIIHQSEENKEIKEQMKQLQSTYAEQLKLINSKDELIRDKDLMIRELKDEIQLLYHDRIPFEKISREAHINYDALREMSFSKRIHTDFDRTDTLWVFHTYWKDRRRGKEQYGKMKEWLKLRVKADSLVVVFHE